MSFNIDNTRKDFPILTREIQGNTLTYLDNAASSQKPFEVLDGIKKFESNDYSNVHRGLHTLSVLSTSAYEESRKTVQKFLNAKSPDEIIFTSGGTDSFNLVASSYADANLSHGDEIIITTMEHHANIVPWHFLRERKGVKIKWIDCDSNGNLDINLFERAITPKTKFISVTQMSNVLGVSPDIKKIIKLSHSHGIPILIDGCQGVVHEKTDVQELDCDFYLFSGHKIYGPTGIGVLYAKSQHLDKMRPWRGGGDMIKQVQKENVTYSEAPNKFEAGTPNITGAVGLGIALNYFDKKIKDPRRPSKGRNVSKIIKEFLKIKCPINKAADVLNKFFKKYQINLVVDQRYFPTSVNRTSKLNVVFSTSFGRQLEYYTGMVFKIDIKLNNKIKNIINGGRYDQLISDLGSKKQISAVGAALNLNY